LICIDTSALMAIVLAEPPSERCQEAIAFDDGPVISAATLAEALIVAGGRGFEPEMQSLLDGLSIRVVEVSREAAIGAANAYRRWGKGYDPARLNYGDCFAYELASRLRCPLLYIGDDFAKTDIASAL
jgi:ribonuclease VapC